MRLRSVGGPRWAALVASLVVLSVGALGGCSAGGSASNPSEVTRPTPGPGQRTLRVLQLNLCNSGRADCYSGGRAVDLAAAQISRQRPDMVSLNEVCREDVDVLQRALSSAVDGTEVAAAFAPARDRRTAAPVRCQNGQAFGDGILAVLPSAAHTWTGTRTYSGVYPIQDPRDVEVRVWVCLALPGQVTECTTHAASSDPVIALAQCRYLVSTAARRAHRHGGGPVIVAGDLNLAAGGSPDPQSCLPPGYRRADDGGLQYVVASPGTAIRSHTALDLRGTTDHPGLLVDLVLTRPAGPGSSGRAGR